MIQSLTTTLAITVLGVAALPVLAQVQPPAPVQAQFNAPQIDAFTVSPVEQLTPGTELTFILQGTPNGRATFAIGNSTNLPMREVEPGVYEGRYTIRNQDQIAANTAVRANLRQGDRSVTARLQQSLTGVDTATAPNSDRGSQALAIRQFSVQPVTELQPGSVLNFTLVGTPNAKATVAIEGVTYNQPLQETTQGTYEGQYVIRRQDVFSDAPLVTASLQSGNQVVRARLNQALATNSTPNSAGNSLSQLPLEILSPANNSQVKGAVELRGRSAPNTTVTVNVRATNSLAGLVGVDRNIVDRTVQTDAQGNFSLTFQPGLVVPGTRYEVSLRATNGSQNREQTLTLVQR